METTQSNKEQVGLFFVSDQYRDSSEKDENSEGKSIFEGGKKCCRWTQQEDVLLRSLIENHGDKNWKQISSNFDNRSPVQCLHRWTKILKPGLTKGPWTEDEDRKLLEWVKTDGPNKWTQCSQIITGRSGKQCRERWYNSLNPNVKKGSWTDKEDFIIFQKFSEYGSKWSKIAEELPGRTENSTKNRFYSTLRRVAAENIKQNRLRHLNSAKSTLSLNDLLAYLPTATEEKSRNYHNGREPLNKKFLSQKTERSNAPTNNITNIKNVFNFNLNFNNGNNNNFCLKDNNKCNNGLGINDLEHMIEQWCEKDFQVNDKSAMGKVDTKINKLLNNKTEIINNFPAANVNLSMANEESVSNFISQLNDLEKFLNVARHELKNVNNITLPSNIEANTSQLNYNPNHSSNILDDYLYNSNFTFPNLFNSLDYNYTFGLAKSNFDCQMDDCTTGFNDQLFKFQ